MKKLPLILFLIIFLSTVATEPPILIPKGKVLKIPLHHVNKYYIALVKINIPEEYIFKYLVVSANATTFTKLLLVRDSICLEKYVAASEWSLTPCLFYRMFPGNYTLVILSNSNNVYLKIKVLNNTYSWFQKALEDKAKLKFSQMPKNVYRNGPIAILVESNIYSNISKAINRFADDIYLLTSIEVLIYSVNFSEPVEVREFLRQLYFTKNISGVILVGNLPLPRMRLFNKTYFSLIYYEDLDGVFVLENNTICLWNNTNGLEIWASLITPPKPVSKSRFLRIIFLNKYFEKNHLYKIGLIRVPHRCLIVVDRDWRYWIKDCYDEVTTLYENCYVIGGFSENYMISAKEYEFHINVGYELATGWVHGGYTFSGGGNFDGLRHEGARKKGPGALVHIMSTCGFSNIDEDWCQALSFVFGDSITLATMGSTKSEGILEAYTLFNALSEGKTLGEAYLYWLNYRFTDDPWQNLSRFNINTSTHSWGLGVVLYGDPTLLLKGEPTYIELDGIRDEGNFIEVAVRLIDNSLQAVPLVPVYCAIKVGRVWRVIDYAVTNSSGEALLRIPVNCSKLAIFTRGAVVGEKFYKPSLSYLDFNEKERNVSLSNVNYVEDLENMCLNVTVNTQGEPLSVVIFYKRENAPWCSVSMMKVGKNKYFIRIPANEKELIKFKIRVYVNSNKYIESNIFKYRLSSVNLLTKVKRSPLTTAIILLVLVLAMILAIKLTPKK